MSDHGLTPAEVRKIRSFKEPYGVQRFLDGLEYHLATSAWSPRRVLRDRTAHCLEGAIFGAAALRVLGYPPLVVDLEAENDTDHLLAVFRQRGHWGAVAASNYAGCRYREPVYRTLRELAMSYFEGYFNLRRQRTLRTFSRPIDLRRYDARGWMTDEKDLWYIVYDLFDVPHTALLATRMDRRLHPVDKRSFDAGLVGHRWR